MDMHLKALAGAAILGAGLVVPAGAVTLNIAEAARVNGDFVAVNGTNVASATEWDATVAQFNGTPTSANTDINLLAYSGSDFTVGDVVNVFGRLNNRGTDPFEITFDSPFQLELQALGSTESATNTVTFLQDGASLGDFIVASASTPTTLAATVAAGTYVFAARGNGGDRSDWDLTFTGLDTDGAVIPLPASLTLLLAALGVTGMWRRRAA